MADITFRELFETPPRILLGPVLGQAVNPVISALCFLYEAAPTEVNQGLSAGFSPSSPIDAILPRLCPLPPERVPLPSVPFSGGQCCVQYDVNIAITIGGNGSSTVFRGLNGKIGPMRIGSAQEPNGLFSRRFYFESGIDCPGRPRVSNTVIGQVRSPGGQFTPASATITSIVRVDGQPDTCGDPPPEYPITTTTPDRYNFDIDIEIDGGTFKMPVKIIPFERSPDQVSKPEINVQVGDFIFNFTAGGLNIGFREAPPGSVPPVADPRSPDQLPPARPLPPLTPPDCGEGGGTPTVCPDVDLQPVLNAIADLRLEVDRVEEDVETLLDCDRCWPQIGSDQLEVAALAGSSGGDFDLEPRARWIEITQTSVPVNARTQDGGAAPRVIYSGWISFGGDRTPISYDENVFRVPVGADRVLITLYDGHEATCKVHYLREI